MPDSRVAVIQAWRRFLGSSFACSEFSIDLGKRAKAKRTQEEADHPNVSYVFPPASREVVLDAAATALGRARLPDDYLQYFTLLESASRRFVEPLHYFLGTLEEDERLIPPSPAFKQHWDRSPEETAIANMLTMVRHFYESLPRADRVNFVQELSMALSRSGYMLQLGRDRSHAPYHAVAPLLSAAA